jgi:hypothetical protein
MDDVVVVPTDHIVRNKKTWELTNMSRTKIYRIVYDKRVLNEDLTTVPFGFDQKSSAKS